MSNFNPKTCDLNFLKGTVYKDMRKIGGNAFRDIKMSLDLGTSSDLIYYLKSHSKLLKNLSGNETAEFIAKGGFSCVYLIKDGDENQVVVKRSHDGWAPLQVGKNIYLYFPIWMVEVFISNYRITDESLHRDVYDYEELLKPCWGKDRVKIESKEFSRYLNMALYMVDHFLPDFSIKNIYSQEFWDKLLERKIHKNFDKLKKYLKNTKTEVSLVPEEERYILYDEFSSSLQTIFIQDAMRGKEEIIPGKKMAFPFELISKGVIPKEMPKIMIEHLLRTIEIFVEQINRDCDVKKVPDFRPLESWKAFPPTPSEMYIAETSNLVVNNNNGKDINVSLVDTHFMLEPKGNLLYRWTELRFWISLFLNIRFWVRKALEFSDR